MKIFFTASLTGKKYYLDNYKKIVEILEREGHTVISEYMFQKDRNDVEKETTQQRQEFHKKFHKWISQADVVVAEISYSSTGVGYQITHALDNGKPVLALHIEDKVPVALIGEIYDKLTIVPYNVPNLFKVISESIEDVKKQMDVRFNFFIPPKIGAYLDWMSKHKKLPRAVFLRRLIEEHMRRNKEYKA